MQASKFPQSGRHGVRSELLLSPATFLAKAPGLHKPLTAKPSKDDPLDQTRLFSKPQKSPSSQTYDRPLLGQNGRPTLKERALFSSSKRESPLAAKVNQHFSPCASSKGLWDSTVGHFSYLQALKQASQATPKSPLGDPRRSPSSLKRNPPGTINCFLSTKHPKTPVGGLTEKGVSPSLKKLVLSENSVWGNRLMEAAIKLKLPERTREKQLSKKENQRLFLPSGVIQSPPAAPYGLVSPSSRKAKTSQLALALGQGTPKPGSLLADPSAAGKMSPIRLKLKNHTAKSKETFKENEAIAPFLDSQRLEEVDLPVALGVSQTLDALSLSLVGGADPSPILKKYTELVQDKKYSSLEAVFCSRDSPRPSQGAKKPDSTAPAEGSSAFNSDIRLAMRLEALAVMHVFYALVEQTVDCRTTLAELIELCCASSHFFFLALESGLSLHSLEDQAAVVRAHLRTHQTYPPRATLSTIAKKIRRNNSSVLSKLAQLGQEASFSKIAPRVSLLLPSLLQLQFERAIESIFECFFETLKQRGAMSVLYNEDPRQPTDQSEEPNFILQPAPACTFLPPKTKATPLTLVLDLDETLVHYAQISNETGEFYIRPFSQEFLIELSPFFEIVIFTAAVKCYADWIVDRLDTQGCISHRLYRCSTKQQKGVFIKDLSRIGRELSKTIIVDNNPDNFQYQSENGIFIKSWYDDPNDTALEELAKLLKLVARRSGEDVRVVLADIRRRIGSKTLKALLEGV